MRSFWIWLLYYLTWNQRVSGLFYHIRSAQQIVPPPLHRNETSYFGYSMAYYPYRKSLIVSAPTEDQVGVVYECSLKSDGCAKIGHDDVETFTNYKHNYWLGATVRATEDFVVTCAPRYTTASKDTRKSIHGKFGTFGRCYYSSENTNVLHAMSGPVEKQRARHTRKLEETMDSLGWSMDISPSHSIVVGGPAMFTGRALAYKRPDSTPVLLSNGDPFSDELDGASFNFGYSVASGYFILEDQLSYAIGSTYGQQGLGMVLFYENPEDLTEDSAPTIDKTLTAEVVGSMYGAVLCAAKISGKGSDLLVGAPTYADEVSYNKGAVYVYTFEYDSTPTYKKTLIGSKDGGMFGTAIITVGDLNGDDLDEIVIAAPYEDPHGTVYLYSGYDLASEQPAHNIEELQKISSSYYRPFGLSLAAIRDDQNDGCNELAISTPTDNAVTVVKTFAAITVKLSAYFPAVKHSKGDNVNHFTVCLNVKYPEKPERIIAEISTEVTMNHPDAALSHAGPDKVVRFNTKLNDKQPQYCRSVSYNVPVEGNYDIRIGYNVTSALVNDPMLLETFECSRVVLSDHSVLELSDSILAAACPGGCKPVLTLKIEPNSSLPYKIGTNAIKHFSLSNTGDVAYDTCLYISVGWFVAHWPASCNKGICSPRRLLKTGETWDMGELELELTGLSNQRKEIEMNVTVFDHCTQREQNVTHKLVVPLFADTNGVEVRGENSISDVIEMSPAEMKLQGKQLQHSYKIISNGAVQWMGLTCEFTVEKKPFYEYGNISREAGNVAPKCIKLEFDKLIKFKCMLDPITDKNKIMTLVLPIMVKPGIYDNLNEAKNKSFSSTFNLYIEGKTKTESVYTTIQLREATIPWWVIMCAAILGLCLLGLFIMAMRECGCLRRQNKQKLDKLKNSVRRQTMRRSMMQNLNVSDRRQDQQQILEHIEIEEH